MINEMPKLGTLKIVAVQRAVKLLLFIEEVLSKYFT